MNMEMALDDVPSATLAAAHAASSTQLTGPVVPAKQAHRDAGGITPAADVVAEAEASLPVRPGDCVVVVSALFPSSLFRFFCSLVTGLAALFLLAALCSRQVAKLESGFARGLVVGTYACHEQFRSRRCTAQEGFRVPRLARLPLLTKLLTDVDLC